MNIVGCIIFIIAGIIAVEFPKVSKSQGLKDYSKCRVAEGIVIGTLDFYGERWAVYFTDEKGREVLGMDDVIAESSFSHKYKRPVSKTEEKVYYYPMKDNGSITLNGKKAEYYIHFCNDDLYELQKHVVKRSCIIGKVVGCILVVCAILILIKS